jgi:transcriptional regulator with XRE-family HTH domain
MQNAQLETFRQQLIATLYTIRKQRGYSHEAIAIKSGLSRQTLGKIESGKANPTMLTMFRITAAMEMTLEEFAHAMKAHASAPAAKDKKPPPSSA